MYALIIVALVVLITCKRPGVGWADLGFWLFCVSLAVIGAVLWVMEHGNLAR